MPLREKKLTIVKRASIVENVKEQPWNRNVDDFFTPKRGNANNLAILRNIDPVQRGLG